MTKFRTLLAIALCAILLAGCEGKDTPTTKKNLLLICIDTVRADIFDALSGMDNDPLQRWQGDALYFADAQSPAPWTVPTVVSVFSGMWPAHHGAGLWPGLFGRVMEEPPSFLSESVPVLAQAALDKGMSTAVLSASFWTAKGPLVRGFNRQEGFIGDPNDTDWREIADAWTKDHLPKKDGQAFFHYLHLMDAHDWHLASDEKLDARLDKLPDERVAKYRAIAPAPSCEDPQSTMCKKFLVYAAAVNHVRAGIATILDTLEERQLLEDTVVVVFSDHGEEFLDHRDDKRPREYEHMAQQDFGHGHTLYAEQLHVPFMMWHDDYSGERISYPVSLVDIAPTVANWLDLEFPAGGFQGVALDVHLAQGTRPAERPIIGSALAFGEQQISVLSGGNKAIWYMVSDHTDYFDLATDPGEHRPLQDDGLVMTFDGLLTEYLQAVPKKQIVPGQLSADEVKRLQAIGYLQGVETAE